MGEGSSLPQGSPPTPTARPVAQSSQQSQYLLVAKATLEPHRGGGSSSVSEAGSTHPYVFVQMPSLNRERERDSVCMLIPQYHTLRIRMSASVDFVRYCTRGHFIPGSSFSYIVLPCLGFPSFCSKGSFSLVSPRLAGLSPPPPPAPMALKAFHWLLLLQG